MLDSPSHAVPERSAVWQISKLDFALRHDRNYNRLLVFPEKGLLASEVEELVRIEDSVETKPSSLRHFTNSFT